MEKIIEQKIKGIFEGFEYEEGRHAKPIVSPENPDEEIPQEQEPSFTDSVAKKIADMQATIDDLQAAIEKETESIRNGNIGHVAGSEKIKSWQNRLNATRYKAQMLQTALDAYMNDQSEDNESKLRIANIKSRQ